MIIKRVRVNTRKVRKNVPVISTNYKDEKRAIDVRPVTVYNTPDDQAVIFSISRFVEDGREHTALSITINTVTGKLFSLF